MPCSEGRPGDAQERRDEKIRKRWAAHMDGSPDLPWEIVVPYTFTPLGKRTKQTGYHTIAAFAHEHAALETVEMLRKRTAPNAVVMRCPC